MDDVDRIAIGLLLGLTIIVGSMNLKLNFDITQEIASQCQEVTQ